MSSSSSYWVYAADMDKDGNYIDYRVLKGTEQEVKEWTSKMNHWAMDPVQVDFGDLTKRDHTMGYFKVEAKGQIHYLYGTKASVLLFVSRHFPTVATHISPISIGLLDSTGVTLEEAQKAVHGVIESILFSAYPKPPHGNLIFKPQ